jgi:superfamily II DNA or RNA helicase
MTPITLRDYQEETVTRLLHPRAGITRSLAVVATGGGKTIIFSALADRLLRPGRRALILAHREELLTQAREKIALAAPSLHVEIEQADSRAQRYASFFDDAERRSVVIGSVQTLRAKRLADWDPSTFDLVVIDEAHHATAQSYLDIIEHFGCMDDRKTRLVGVTATPQRTDGVGLGNVFQEIAVNYDIRSLVKMGHLVPIKARRVYSDIDLRGISVRAGEFAQNELEEVVNTAERNEQIVAAWEEHAPGLRTIVFAAGVAHARSLAHAFRTREQVTEMITGDMDADLRARALASYQRGDTLILTNYAVLTEGFDAPETGCIVLARPTKSSLVMTQMVGRGTRLAPGKDSVLVIDVRDVTKAARIATKATLKGKPLPGVAELAGLDPDFDPQGEDIFALGEEMDKLDPRLHRDAVNAEQLALLIDKEKRGMSVAEIDLFAALDIDDSVRAASRLAWRQMGDDVWSIRPEKNWTYEIHVDTLGKYVVRHRESQATLGIFDRRDDAFACADNVVREINAERMPLIDITAAWRSHTPSHAQMTKLHKLIGKDNFEQLPENITKGDVSMLIDAFSHRSTK